MRVTKLIKDYVTKSVDAIYSPKEKEIGAEYFAKRDEMDKALEAIVEEANAKAKALLEENGFDFSYGCKEFIATYHHSYNCDMEQEISLKKRELRKQREEKINDILLNLELGATRAELDEMIKNLSI